MGTGKKRKNCGVRVRNLIELHLIATDSQGKVPTAIYYEKENNMSYRKITVDHTEYEYTVGETMVKVKGFLAVPKHEVGETVIVNEEDQIMVTPQHVVEWIRKHTTK